MSKFSYSVLFGLVLMTTSAFAFTQSDIEMQQCTELSLVPIIDLDKDADFKGKVRPEFWKMESEMRQKCYTSKTVEFDTKSCEKKCSELFFAMGSNRSKCTSYCGSFELATTYFKKGFKTAEDARYIYPTPDCSGNVSTSGREINGKQDFDGGKLIIQKALTGTSAQ